MDDEDSRAALAALIADRREDYAALSRLLGRNPAYIQQFVKRGTPRRLAEDDRRTLANFFGVDEAMLGAPPPASPPTLVSIARSAVGASAGPGALVDDDAGGSAIALPPALLRALGVRPGAHLSMIRVVGDSMVPTLHDGDDILVDRSDAADRLRDGVYVLRLDDALVVKRIVIGPGGSLAVRSDNRDHRSWTDVDRSALTVIGRVVWSARRVR